jgi:hypothetical protein
MKQSRTIIKAGLTVFFVLLSYYCSAGLPTFKKTINTESPAVITRLIKLEDGFIAISLVHSLADFEGRRGVILSKFNWEGEKIWEKTHGHDTHHLSILINIKRQTNNRPILLKSGFVVPVCYSLIELPFFYYKTALLKFSYDGELIYEKVYTEFEEANANLYAKLCPEGYIYTAGHVQNKLQNRNVIYLSKTDTNANLIWEKRIEYGNREWQLRDFFIDPEGHLLISGYHSPYEYNSQHLTTDFSMKLDSEGGVIWERHSEEKMGMGSWLFSANNRKGAAYMEYRVLDANIYSQKQETQTLFTWLDKDGKLVDEKTYTESRQNYRTNTFAKELEDGGRIGAGLKYERTGEYDYKAYGIFEYMDSSGEIKWTREYCFNEQDCIVSFANSINSPDGGYILGGFHLTPDASYVKPLIIRVDSNGCLYSDGCDSVFKRPTQPPQPPELSISPGSILIGEDLWFPDSNISHFIPQILRVYVGDTVRWKTRSGRSSEIKWKFKPAGAPDFENNQNRLGPVDTVLEYVVVHGGSYIYYTNHTGYFSPGQIIATARPLSLDNTKEYDFKPQIYPNPTRNAFFITMNKSPNEPLNLKIFDATGRLVEHNVLQHEQKIEVQLPFVLPGTYLVKVRSDNDVYYEKLLIY